MELSASMSNEERDMIESYQSRAALNRVGKFHDRVIATKAISLILAMMMGITTSLPVCAQMSPSEHASHHPSNSGSPAAELTEGTEAKTSPSPVAATPANPIVQQSEHASHHPGNNATAASGQTESKAGALPVATPVNPMMQMMTPSKTPAGPPGCCGMMATGGKPFYPSLMDFPKLTDEARKYIRSEAVARLGSGAQMITASQAELHHALSTNDAVAAQNALKQVHLGLSFAESGASALEALNESQPPPRIALTWFKREMNISDSSANNGFRDISWFHLASMLLLAATLLIAFIFRWARLRRINSLIQRLTPDNTATLATNIASKPIYSSKLPETLMPPPNTEHFVPRPWTGILRIKRIFDEAPNVKTFRLMEPNLDSMPFTFLPGQYATVTSEINDEKVRRSYTISSSPTQRDYIELTVKREQYGLESRHLHDHAIPGDLLEVSAPAGNFFFTGKEANGIVLIAGGVGITPMMSVLRYLTDRSYPKDIHLLYAVNSPSSIIFREECDYLAHRHPNVHIDVIVTSTEGIPWTGSVGLITADFIIKTVPDVAHHRIHLCGPPPMMSAVKAALLQLKIPSDQVKTENFAPPKGGPVLNAEPTVTSSDKMPIIPPSSQATITFSKSEKSGKLAPDQSILEAAEDIGVFIDNECRVGTCGRCKVPLLKGTVTMEVQDALSVDEKASGIILACQAKSPNDLVVEA